MTQKKKKQKTKLIKKQSKEEQTGLLVKATDPISIFKTGTDPSDTVFYPKKGPFYHLSCIDWNFIKNHLVSIKTTPQIPLAISSMFFGFALSVTVSLITKNFTSGKGYILWSFLICAIFGSVAAYLIYRSQMKFQGKEVKEIITIMNFIEEKFEVPSDSPQRFSHDFNWENFSKILE